MSLCGVTHRDLIRQSWLLRFINVAWGMEYSWEASHGTVDALRIWAVRQGESWVSAFGLALLSGTIYIVASINTLQDIGQIMSFP